MQDVQLDEAGNVIDVGADKVLTPPPQTDKSEPSWWLDENTPGVGERPTWLPEKFKSAKDVANSFQELEKKMGAGAPTEYDFGEYGEDFDKDHEAFKELQAFAKEKRVPQEVMTKMLESVSKYGKSFIPDAAAERAKIGQDADRRIEVLDNWAKANLSEKSYKALAANLRDADSILAFEEVRAKMINSNSPSIPSGSDLNTAAVESVADVKGELEDPATFKKYQENEKFRSDWKRRLEKAAEREQGAGYASRSGGV